MNRSVTAGAFGQRVASPRVIARAGDVGLASIWTVLSVASISKVFTGASEEPWLGTAHQAVSAIVLCVTAVLFIIRRPTKARAEAWHGKLIAIAGSLIMPAVILMPLTWTPDWVLTACTAGLVLTHLVVFWSLLTLRRSFSIFPEARALIRSGPYALVRHPLYSTYTVMYLFFLLPRLSLLSVVAVVVGVGCEVWRARTEERILRTTFPEYDAYAATTPRFVPRIRTVRT